MKKCYRLIYAIGRSQSVIFKSEPFDAMDGDADMMAYRAACEARKNKDAELCKTGCATFRITGLLDVLKSNYVL